MKDKKIQPSCSYCKHGDLAPDGSSVLCIKKGVVDKAYSCRRFSYDILKRQPRRPEKIRNDFNPEDFSI